MKPNIISRSGMLVLLPAFATAGPFRTFNNGGGDANFGTAANWDSNTVPGTTEGAVINVASPNVALQITSDQTVDTLRINDGRTVTQTGGVLTISNGNNENGLWIGEFGGGNVYNMNGGTIQINDPGDGLILGKNGGSEGTLNFTSGIINHTSGETFIGADQKGVWVQTGGVFNGATVTLAKWGSPNFEQGIVYLDGGIFAANEIRKGDGNEAFLNLNGGTLQARSDNASFLHGMNRANVRNGGVTVDSVGHNITISQQLLHSNIGGDAALDGGLRKSGTGTLVLTGFSSFTGATEIDGGVLAIGVGGSLYQGGTMTGNLRVNSGGTLRFDRTDVFGNAANTSPVTITVRSGGNVRSNGNFNSIHQLVMDGGSLTADGGLSVAGAYGLNGTVSVTGTATSRIVNGGGNDNYIRIGREGTSDSTVFNVSDAGGRLTVGVELRDNFSATSGLTKIGAGTLELEVTATHQGPTTVSAGTLLANAGLSGSGAVNVTSGARLGGSGTVNGNTTVAGILAPGSSASSNQSFGGDLTFQGPGSIFEWDISFSAGDTGTAVNGGNAHDKVAVAGTLGGSGSTFQVLLQGGDFSAPFWSVSRSWNDIFTAGNSVNLAQIFSTVTYGGNADPSGHGSFSLSGSTLQWSAVPEPTGLLAGSLLAVGLLRRRRS